MKKNYLDYRLTTLIILIIVSIYQLYSFIVVDRQSGHKTEYPLPAVASGTRCLGYGIRVEEDKFNPFVFLQKDSDFFIENLKLTTR